MLVQIHSDFHLENYKEYFKIIPKAEILILAGDIGRLDNRIYIKFIKYVAKRWKKIFLVLGNHEYYNKSKSYQKLNQEYRSFLGKFGNIFLLDKDIYLMEDILIIGCTLWSDIDERVYDYINDFRQINNLSIKEYQYLHEQDKNFLLSNLDNSYKKIIIITHYPLIRENTSHPKYQNDPIWLKNYFSNSIDLDYNNKQIICIAGHTHYNYNFIKNNVRYLSNRFGYGVFELFT